MNQFYLIKSYIIMNRSCGTFYCRLNTFILDTQSIYWWQYAFYTVFLHSCIGTFTWAKDLKSLSAAATHAHESLPTWACAPAPSCCSSWTLARSFVMQMSFSAISLMLSFWIRCRQESSLCRCASLSLLPSACSAVWPTKELNH